MATTILALAATVGGAVASGAGAIGGAVAGAAGAAGGALGAAGGAIGSGLGAAGGALGIGGGAGAAGAGAGAAGAGAAGAGGVGGGLLGGAGATSLGGFVSGATGGAIGGGAGAAGAGGVGSGLLGGAGATSLGGAGAAGGAGSGLLGGAGATSLAGAGGYSPILTSAGTLPSSAAGAGSAAAPGGGSGLLGSTSLQGTGGYTSALSGPEGSGLLGSTSLQGTGGYSPVMQSGQFTQGTGFGGSDAGQSNLLTDAGKKLLSRMSQSQTSQEDQGSTGNVPLALGATNPVGQPPGSGAAPPEPAPSYSGRGSFLQRALLGAEGGSLTADERRAAYTTSALSGLGNALRYASVNRPGDPQRPVGGRGLLSAGRAETDQILDRASRSLRDRMAQEAFDYRLQRDAGEMGRVQQRADIYAEARNRNRIPSYGTFGPGAPEGEGIYELTPEGPGPKVSDRPSQRTQPRRSNTTEARVRLSAAGGDPSKLSPYDRQLILEDELDTWVKTNPWGATGEQVQEKRSQLERAFMVR